MTDALPARATMATPLVVLLAAGAGARFTDDGHKLVAELQIGGRPDAPKTVFGWSLLHAVEADVGPIVVVTGAIDAVALAADPVTAHLLARPGVETISNPDWAAGQSTSVRVGVDAAAARGATSVVIGLGDQPFVSAAAWQAVAAGSGPITVATYDGIRGNPVRIHADVWDRLPSSGDEGARVLMREHPELVTGVPCTGSPADIDTMEDLRRWQNN